MSNNIKLSINTQLSFASYQEAVSAQAVLVRAIEAVLGHPIDFNFVKDVFTMSADTTDEKDSTFDQWIRKFLKSTKSDEMNDHVLFEFACALCDDIPFGYESSHRLASILFAYLERKQGLR